MDQCLHSFGKTRVISIAARRYNDFRVAAFSTVSFLCRPLHRRRFCTKNSMGTKNVFYFQIVLVLLLTDTLSRVCVSTSLRAAEKPKSFLQGYTCQICEDVALTLRDTSKCRGMEGLPKDGRGDGTVETPQMLDDLTPCTPPGHCNMWKDEAKREKCSSLKKAWRQDVVTLGMIYENHENGKTPLDMCISLGQCRPESSAEGSECASVLRGRECKDNIYCDSSACKSDDCLACYWIIKTWPFFSDLCHPKKGVTSRKGGISSKEFYKDAKRAVLSPPLTGDAEFRKTPPDSATLGKECYEMYDKFVFSKKARYLITYVGDSTDGGWNANTMCKCLGECAYDEYQSPFIEEACQEGEPGVAEKLSPLIVASLFPDIQKEKGDPEKLRVDTQLRSDDVRNAKEWWSHGQ
jgi:hypothetical protein